MYPPNFPQEMPHQSPATPQAIQPPDRVMGFYQFTPYVDKNQDKGEFIRKPAETDRKQMAVRLRRKAALYQILFLIAVAGVIGLVLWIAVFRP